MLRSNGSIGELIHDYRATHKYSQLDLATKLNVTVSAVSSWERGVSKPTVDIAFILSEDMGLTLDEFYTTNKDKQKRGIYNLSDEIPFERAYVNVNYLNYDLDQHAIFFGITVHGLTVFKENIQQLLKVKMANDQVAYAPLSMKIEEKSYYKNTTSPEFSFLPISAKIFQVQVSFPYNPYESIQLEIAINNEVAVVPINGDIIEWIDDGVPFDPSNFETTHHFLRSESFREGLKFLAKVEGTDTLQTFMVMSYEYLKDYLQPGLPKKRPKRKLIARRH
jgi:transcriptional regulator with XRE-family HTH domain